MSPVTPNFALTFAQGEQPIPVPTNEQLRPGLHHPPAAWLRHLQLRPRSVEWKSCDASASSYWQTDSDLFAFGPHVQLFPSQTPIRGALISVRGPVRNMYDWPKNH